MTISNGDLAALGWPGSRSFGLARRAAAFASSQGRGDDDISAALRAILADPGAFVGDAVFGKAAAALAAEGERAARRPDVRAEPVKYSVWGAADIDAATLEQMENACRLPVAVAGAQMPDGHVGYGLPIGGVLATRNAVIPYGVGVDIACRMKLTIVDEDASRLDGLRDRLRKALVAETAFGMGAQFRGDRRREHDVMDDPAWDEMPKPIAKLRDRAWSQLGSSGSGNHFVEWVEVTLPDAQLGLAPGRHIGLMSHSGSRNFGQVVAKHFTDLAMELCVLPKQFRHLAWLDLDTEPGRDYWKAMNLAGRYASANHDLIHRHVLRSAGFKPALQLENHHNFAWIEEHGGERLVVHRKGATPAGLGVLGIIPGSMADAGFIVRGKGHPKSLDSAAHGAGRRMSRKAARQALTRSDMKRYLADHGVELISAGLDEAPMAYKRINEVMASQKDLVEIIASIQPRIVLMADDDTAED